MGNKPFDFLSTEWAARLAPDVLAELIRLQAEIDATVKRIQEAHALMFPDPEPDAMTE